MTYKEIKQLIDVINESNLAEVKIKKEDFELSIRTDKYEKSRSQSTYLAGQQPIIAPPASPQPATVINPVQVAAPEAATNGELVDEKPAEEYYDD